MFTKANWYYVWKSKRNLPIGGFFSWGFITVAAIILGFSDGIQGLEDIRQFLTNSSTSSQGTQISNSRPSKGSVIAIIILAGIITSINNYLKNSRDQGRASQISKAYLHDILRQKLGELHNNITSNHPLQGNFRVYIAMPYSKNRLSLIWNYKISFSYMQHNNDKDISINVNEGELGYLIHNLKALKSQKYVPQTLELNPNFPLGYNRISQENMLLIDQIFVVYNANVMGLFDKEFLCGLLVVTTDNSSNIQLLRDQAFKEQLTAFVRINEELITTIWQTTKGTS
jgi:hypothetical protein